MSPVRLRLTLFYAALLATSSAVMLGASYLLVRGRLHSSLAGVDANAAMSALASQYVLAIVLLALGGGWLVTGEVLGPWERAIAAQKRFVANASHELRTPMTAIRAAAEVALDDPAPTVAGLRRALRETVDATEATEQLTASLLALASAAEATPAREPLDLAELVRATLPHHARVDAQLHPAPMRGDASLLTRASANLLENAVRHGLPGHVVEVRVRDGELVVANDCAPIAREDLARLAEPFERGGRHGAGGTGLGLSIVDAIARAHGGRLELESPRAGRLVARVSFPPSG